MEGHSTSIAHQRLVTDSLGHVSEKERLFPQLRATASPPPPATFSNSAHATELGPSASLAPAASAVSYSYSDIFNEPSLTVTV